MAFLLGSGGIISIPAYDVREARFSCLAMPEGGTASLPTNEAKWRAIRVCGALCFERVLLGSCRLVCHDHGGGGRGRLLDQGDGN